MAEKTPCAFPDCPAGTIEKYSDERHAETTNTLREIKAGQDKVLNIMTNLAGVNADMVHIKDRLGENTKEHDAIFERLRTVEGREISSSGVSKGMSMSRRDLWMAIGIISAVVVALEVLVKLLK